MRENEFKIYLKTVAINAKGTHYAESTAGERVWCCNRVQNEFNIDLDIVSLDYKKQQILINDVLAKKWPNINRYIDALTKYFDFAKMSPPTCHAHIPCDLARLSPHFYKKNIDTLPQKYHDIIGDLESEYEAIMGYGRNLLGMDSGNLLKNTGFAEIERIPVILSPEKKEITHKPTKEYIANKIAELAQKKRGDISKEDILDILNSESFTEHIAGEFIQDQQPYIIIYYNVINGNGSNELIANVSKVLAHEYMHYMEYIYCLAHGVSSYTNKFLSEAMADFFGFIYSIKCKTAASIAIAQKRYYLWEDRFGSCWPYAEALHFCTVNGSYLRFSNEYNKYVKHGCEAKLKEVFHRSLDANTAYKTLKTF
jgi:hypothetical protein